jgi:hypothetical protein
MAEQLEPGCQVADRYVVEELIGVGGFADVYRARHVELGSVHALKVLTWRKKGLAERFINEGRVQANLGHPNVVTVTDVLRFEGHVALVMEYVDGTNLELLIAERGALPLQEAMALFVPMLAAVAAAHDRKIWHRDLKPANVLLARTAVGWVPKVADFGIAKIMDEMSAGQTSSGVAMGSPGYMSPEQVRDSSTVDQRSDVFALGAILYEMLTGKRAFADADGSVTLTSTLDRDPPLITDPAIPPEVALAVQRAMSREREQRFSDCRALAKALGIGGHPLLLDAEGRAMFASMEFERDRTGIPPTLSPPAVSALRTGPTGGWLVVPFAAGTLALVASGALLLISAVLFVLVRGRLSGEPEAEAEVIPPIVSERSTAAAPDPAVTPSPVAPAPEVPAPAVPVAAPPGEVAAAPSPAAPSSAAPSPAAPSPAAPAPAQPVSAAPGTPEVAATPAPPAPPSPSSAGTPDGTDPSDLGTPPSPVPAAPVPAPAVAAAAQPAQYDPSTLLGGVWKGTALNFPIELRFSAASAEQVRGEALFFAGTSQSRVILSGSLDPATGTLQLRSADGRYKFEGRLRGQSISGTYQQGGGKLLEWKVAR